MIFNPLIIVASELGIRDLSEPPKPKEQQAMVAAFRKVKNRIGSVKSMVYQMSKLPSLREMEFILLKPICLNLEKTTIIVQNQMNAERQQLTTWIDITLMILLAVPDDMPELKPYYMQEFAALSDSDVGIATGLPLTDEERYDNEVFKG